ncbi:MAG: glycosyltransferase family 9 protein [Bacteroidales bacterium]
MERVEREHYAILRFSALGDVAIAAPLIKGYASANPHLLFTMVSKPHLKALFEGCDNLLFLPVDFKGSYRGLVGLFKLYQNLLSARVTHIADLQWNLRGWILYLFSLSSKLRYGVIDKGRGDKRRATRRRGKLLKELPSTMARYEAVLNGLGLMNINFSQSNQLNGGIEKLPYSKKNRGAPYRVGIAPFSKHRGKEWPLEKIERVVATLSATGNFAITLFGGAQERSRLESIEKSTPTVRVLAGRLSFEEELDEMASLDLMVAMDSANMHFASALGVPVLSIWGATHPYLGFYGFRQHPSMALMEPIECRPCSSYGATPCYRGDWACLENLSHHKVLNRIYQFFDLNQ